MKTWMLISILAAAPAICAQDNVHQKRPTIPELVKQNGPEPVRLFRSSELVLESIESVLPRSELIVYGTVDRVTTYLSDDERDLYTDYSIMPLRLIPRSNQAGDSEPQTREPLIVKTWGGRTTIDGVEVVQQEDDVRLLGVGEKVVFLVNYDVADANYTLTSPVSGAFSVSETGMAPIAQRVAANPIFDRIRRLNAAQFEAEVRRLNW